MLYQNFRIQKHIILRKNQKKLAKTSTCKIQSKLIFYYLFQDIKTIKLTFIKLFIDMDKSNMKNAKIMVQHLEKYINFQFSDFNPPPLEEFLALNKPQYQYVTLPTYSIGPDTPIPKEIAQKLQIQSIIYLHTGAIQLHRKDGRSFTREIQYKDASFFSLINYRSIAKAEPEWFRLHLKTKSIISIIPINQVYNYHWMKHIWQKKVILSKIFLFGQPEIQVLRKKNRFRDFMNHFQIEVFRRQTRIAIQGKLNDKLYIISKGQAKLYKQLKLKNKNKGDINKNVQIVYLREGSIIGGELFLINNKSIHTIINNHSGNQQPVIDVIREQTENEDEELNEESRGKSRKAKKMYDSIKVDDGGYQLYKPHDNINNYTIVAESANVQIYHIKLSKLVQIINQRYKLNFIQLYSSFYITSLRRTHEKMILAMDIQKHKVQNQKNNIQLIAAKAYSSHQERRDIQSEQNKAIIMRKSSLGVMTSNLKELKREEVWLNQNSNIQAKTNILVRQKKSKIDFKQKIEALIENKLNGFKGQNKDAQQYGMITQDLCQIFMKNNQGRTQDIEKRNSLIEKKAKILQSRGGWKQGWDQLKPEGISVQKQRHQSLTNLNYLSGLKISEYADKIKLTCSHKIHQTNKIKQQFMKIRSECPSCSCYDGFQTFKTERKTQTLTGFTRTGYKTAEGWGRTSRVSMEQQSLETVYNKMKFLSERSKQKYNHNIHLLHLHRNKNKLQRRRTAPKLS